MLLKKSILLIISIFIAGSLLGEKLDINFEEIFEGHKIPRLIIDSSNGHIVKANKAASKFYGYPLEKLLLMNIYEINVLRKKDIDTKMNWASHEKNNNFRFKHRLADGTIRDVEVHSYPFVKKNKTYLYSLIIDVSSEVEALNQLKKNHRLITQLSISTISLLFFSIFLLYNLKEKYRNIAFHDHLTGVHTRRLLSHLNFEKLTKETDIATLVMIDVNDFKVINDKFGHLTGDKVLKKIAKTIKNVLRKDDLIIRYGGDEFLLVLKEIDIQDASSIMNRIETQLSKLKGFPFSINISFGIEEINESRTLVETIKSADEKMYEMKKLKVSLY